MLQKFKYLFILKSNTILITLKHSIIVNLGVDMVN